MRKLVLIATCLSVLMVQLDTTIVNLGVRPLEVALRARVSAIQWVVDAYTIAYAGLIVAGGAIGDRIGRKPVFIAGIAVFTAGCALCAAAGSAVVLIGARAFAGIGAALACAIGLWAGTNGIAIAIGPTLGGALLDAFGWRSMFLVTVPLGIVALALGCRIHVRVQRPSGAPLDVISLAFAVAGLTAFAYTAIDRAWLAGMLSVVVLLGLLQRERLAREPLIPKSFLRARAFRAALATASCMTFGMYAFSLRGTVGGAAPTARQRASERLGTRSLGRCIRRPRAVRDENRLRRRCATRDRVRVGDDRRRPSACTLDDRDRGAGVVGGRQFPDRDRDGPCDRPDHGAGARRGIDGTERHGFGASQHRPAHRGDAWRRGARRRVAPALSIAAAVEILGAGCAYAFARG